MASVHGGPVAGLAAQLVLLLVLSGTVGLGATGWLLGVAYGLVTAVALARGLAGHEMPGLGAANRVTLTRAVLVGGVTALAAGGWAGPTGRVLLSLTGVALALDALDGWVARRTGTVSALGGRFDMEVDAFLLLVLSILVARWAGAWVLLIGAARYLFVLAGWLRPWMRRTLPARPWRKVVTATQGVVLTANVVPRGPRWVLVLALTVAWGMLAESFGRDVWWLWVRREPLGDPALEGVPAAMAPNDA
ncbi:CDP-alcohol phosphatidyltransferase family protein [Pedococcus sp.]|jgi:phosphatidylglycerophosphate synthase|uniref:CDP-alcohol phosphatidyltransferase family protein n=1 Tax=Pedococcus sp. TaxID=2860345 RepID=UPI002E101F64|nr:CDP-alcohol phosphatidyltransferase family protein [Pedococcus sp.]